MALTIFPVAPVVSSAGHIRRNLAVEVLGMKPSEVEDPEDFLLDMSFYLESLRSRNSCQCIT